MPSAMLAATGCSEGEICARGRTMKTLARAGDKAEILRRLRRLRADSSRQWGRMSSGQMVCHLTDCFLMGTPEKPVSDRTSWYDRTIIKWLALYIPLRWPQSIETRPEVDQEAGGTRPTAFETDLATLASLVELITTRSGDFAGRRHPAFGPMSAGAWMRWGYLHMDHHLRQFGV